MTVTLEKTYGDIEVYKINLPVKNNKWVVAPEKYINTQTEFMFSNLDSFSSLGLPYVNFSTLHRRANASSKINSITPEVIVEGVIPEQSGIYL